MNDPQRNGFSRKKQNILAAVFCAAGVGLNMGCSAVVSALGLPLYLDTAGTVVIAVSGGYLPGVIVGFATNIIKSIMDSSAIYYGVLNVLIAVVAAFLAGRGWFKKVAGIFGSILVFTLIGGGIGALIPMFMEGLSFDSESLAGMLYGTGHFSESASYLLSSLIMDLPDKVVTVLLAVLLLRLIPASWEPFFCFRGWMQRPGSVEEMTRKTGARPRVMQLQVKILLALGAALTIVAVVGTVVSIKVYEKSIIRDHMQQAQGTAKIAAGALDADLVEEYLESGEKAEGYEDTRSRLEEILDSSSNITYLYVYQIKEDGCHVVFDLEGNGIYGAEPGMILPFDEGFQEYIPLLLWGERIEPIITNDEYGFLLTAYEPVYDSAGRCVCYVGADVDMEDLAASQRSFLVEMITIYLSFFLLICVIVIWLTQYHIVFPVKAITKYVDVFSEAADSQEQVDKSVKRFRSVDVHTGDEVEILYNSLSKMLAGQAEQTRSIRRLSNSTAKMQDGLIITMADMVENRDSDTGAHVQKTAAYVKIIVEGLKKKGYYAEKITPKFISDTVRSAPLHDVGKINIPDGILNKPGKLTPEEFEIMKRHTTEGKKIIEHAISTMEGDHYLKEARNMAAYHHERWDGKGYPEQLHGEVIPLSARIMAVADVFDALTSPRIYKPAFPLEEALAIIEESKGTQFDPKCVEVFMDSLPEVKVILRKFNQDV